LKESAQTHIRPGEIEVQFSVHSVAAEGISGVRVYTVLFEGIGANPYQAWRNRGAIFRTLGKSRLLNT